MLKLVLVH